MGHSFLSIENKHERLNDTQIEICVYLIEDALKGQVVSEGVKRHVESWSKAVREAAPGCIDLDLDKLTDSERADSVSLISKALEVLSDFGSSIPKKYLNEKTGVDRELFFDSVNVAIVRESLIKFQNVLKKI